MVDADLDTSAIMLPKSAAHLKAVHTTRYVRKVNFDEVYKKRNDQRQTHTHVLSKRDDDDDDDDDDDLPAFAECGGGRHV